MAAKPGAGAMVDHVRVAASAFGEPAAGVAHEHGRVAAPVEEQQHLLALLERALHGVEELERQPVFERTAAQIHHLDNRCHRAFDP